MHDLVSFPERGWVSRVYLLPWYHRGRQRERPGTAVYVIILVPYVSAVLHFERLTSVRGAPALEDLRKLVKPTPVPSEGAVAPTSSHVCAYHVRALSMAKTVLPRNPWAETNASACTVGTACVDARIGFSLSHAVGDIYGAITISPTPEDVRPTMFFPLCGLLRLWTYTRFLLTVTSRARCSSSTWWTSSSSAGASNLPSVTTR